MEVQEQIVAELDQIKDLIAKNRELLSQLDNLAQSLLRLLRRPHLQPQRLEDLFY